MSDKYDDLEKLADLKNKGIITEEEFNLKKSQILNQDDNKQSIVRTNELPHVHGIRPKEVETALKILYISLGIGFLAGIIKASSAAQGLLASPALVMFFVFCIVGMQWLFISWIGKGRNWARITFLVVFIIGIPFLPVFLNFDKDPFSALISIGQTVLQIIALIFLFQKPSSNWFMEMKRRKI